MTQFARTVLACLTAFAPLFTACVAPRPAEGPAPEVAQEAAAVRVSLTPAGDHLVAEWTLPRPVTEFVFDDGAMAVSQRADEWMADTDAFAFDGRTLARRDGAAFDEFSLSVPPARRFEDRFYVPVYRVGETGWGVYAWAFAPEDADVRVTVRGLPEGSVVFAQGEMLAPDAEVAASASELVYFGPASNVHQGLATVVAGSDVPAWIRDGLDAAINGAVGRLTDRFGHAPDAPPVLFVTYQAEWDSTGWKGGALGRFITAHLRAMDPVQGDTAFMDRLTRLALHESAHVWLGGMYPSSENDTQSWLHEGAAEYVALRLALPAGRLRDQMEARITSCRRALGASPILVTETASRGATPYDCGPLVQLIADAAARQAGRGDILDIWKDVFDAAGETGSFDTALFKAAATARGGEAFAANMAALERGLADAGAWRDFLGGLSGIGIEIDTIGPEAPHPDAPGLAAAALIAVQKDRCGGGYSLDAMADHFRIRMGDACGPELAGNPKVRSLDGIDLIAAPGDAYAALRRACAAGDPVTLGTLEGRQVGPFACGPAMSSLPDVVRVTALPDFAPL